MGNDRRKAGEESYRQKFEELGLAESFEFVKRVWESDKGKKVTVRCKSCGKMCNPDDHSWTNHSGPMRPSVDHIIPLAKGGPHDWDNVQVAHIICNSAKGDKVVNE